MRIALVFFGLAICMVGVFLLATTIAAIAKTGERNIDSTTLFISFKTICEFMFMGLILLWCAYKTD